MIDAETHRQLVLIVEDNETIRHAFTVLLEESGYRVAQAGSGEEALRIARSEQPGLILMDLGLPDMGGLEVTRQLKAEDDTRDITVVALTGRALGADQEACIDAGCNGYLSKPVDTRQLLSQIASYLG